METPPNYTSYPRAGGVGGGGRPYRGQGIHFEFITDAFDMIKKRMDVYVVGSLLVMVLTQIIQFPFSFINNYLMYGSWLGGGKVGPNGMPIIHWINMPFVLILSLIPTAIAQGLGIGLTLCALEDADTGNTSLGTLFSGFRNFLPMAATYFLYMLATLIGTICCIIPGIYLGGALAFGPIMVVKEGLGPIEALQKSYKMMSPYAFMYFLLIFVAGLTNFLGLFACCIGILFTYPIMFIVVALQYREFRGPLDQNYQAPVNTTY